MDFIKETFGLFNIILPLLIMLVIALTLALVLYAVYDKLTDTKAGHIRKIKRLLKARK